MILQPELTWTRRRYCVNVVQRALIGVFVTWWSNIRYQAAVKWRTKMQMMVTSDLSGTQSTESGWEKRWCTAGTPAHLGAGTPGAQTYQYAKLLIWSLLFTQMCYKINSASVLLDIFLIIWFNTCGSSVKKCSGWSVSVRPLKGSNSTWFLPVWINQLMWSLDGQDLQDSEVIQHTSCLADSWFKLHL